MNDVCYQVGVPEVSASSGSGNLYLQLRAPTTYTWVALGTGTQMSGANIFLMYADGTRNVTVSARKGTGHVQPQHQTETKLELLAGSGIVDNGNTMLANLRCANCESWSGGSMRLSDTSAPFLAAWQKGKALNTKNLEATITQHDDESRFTFDLAKATVADDANPFVQASNGGTGGGGTTTPPPISGGPGSDDAGSALPAWLREIPTIRTAHGTLMSIVMVVLYPLGSVLMPLSGNWVLHAVWQLVSFLAMWAAFGLGVILAQRTGYVSLSPFGSTSFALEDYISIPFPRPIHKLTDCNLRVSTSIILFSALLWSRSSAFSHSVAISIIVIMSSTRSAVSSPTGISGTAEP